MVHKSSSYHSQHHHVQVNQLLAAGACQQQGAQQSVIQERHQNCLQSHYGLLHPACTPLPCAMGECSCGEAALVAVQCTAHWCWPMAVLLSACVGTAGVIVKTVLLLCPRIQHVLSRSPILHCPCTHVAAQEAEATPCAAHLLAQQQACVLLAAEHRGPVE